MPINGFSAAMNKINKGVGQSSFELPCTFNGSIRPGHKLNIGAYSGIFGGTFGNCSIGRFCSIAPECLVGQDEHPVDWLSSSMLQYVNNVHGWKDYAESEGVSFTAPLQRHQSNKPVEIGHDVWIGHGSFIRGGVKIGDGAIVAGKSVVVKDVEPYQIVGGNPARPIRQRFPDQIVSRLLKIRWWQYEILSLSKLNFSRIEAALDVIEEALSSGDLKEMMPKTVTLSDVITSV